MHDSSSLILIDFETNLNKKLIQSVISEDVDQILICLKLGADVEAQDEDGDTPLCLAAIKGNFTIVSMLIEYSANVNAVNNEEQSPLFQATAHGSMDVVIKLLENRATIEGKNIDNVSIKELIKQIWSLEDNLGKTPLMTSLEIDPSLQLAEQLLQLGASIDAPNSRGITPFLHMCGYGSRTLVSRFFSYIDNLIDASIIISYADNCSDTFIKSFFSYMVDHINNTFLRKIITNVLKAYFINQQDNSGINALFIAVKLKKPALVQLLLPFADMDAPDKNGDTPYSIGLQLAEESPLVAKLLKKQRQLIDQKIITQPNGDQYLTQQEKTRNLQMDDNQHSTTNEGIINKQIFINNQLINTIISGDILEAINLLNKGAKIEAEDRNGNTPLLLAIQYGHANLVATLLHLGANIQKINKEYIGPLEAAIRKQNLPITRLVVEKVLEKGMSSCPIDKEEIILKVIHMIQHNQEHYLQLLKMLLELGFSANAASFYNREVALCQAAKMGCLPAIDLLITHNAMIGKKDYLGGSALFYASMLNDLSVANMLLQHGANINEALFHAATIGNIGSINKLLDLGAEINGHNINNTSRQQLIDLITEQLSGDIKDIDLDKYIGEKSDQEDLDPLYKYMGAIAESSDQEDLDPPYKYMGDIAESSDQEDMEIDQPENSSNSQNKKLRFII
jgi:ankyrin repeat protein